MAKSHEETNVIMLNQVMLSVRHGYTTIHIVCDDTLCVHFFKTLNITIELLMVPTSYKPRNLANIGSW